jgi:hypothetical protein
LRDREQGIAVRGFAELQKVMKTIDADTMKELRKRLKIVGKDVAEAARGGVSHKTGRHGGSPRIEDSIQATVTQNAASVYSTAPHGGAQNYGGRVGRNHATVLARAEVSQYMTRGVKSQREHVAEEMDSLLDWVVDTFDRGK